MRYLGRDSRAGEVSFDQEKATSLALQAKLDSINCEHGDAYIEGIQPHFDILKARHFDSSWNWVRQDALLMYYDIIFGWPIEKSPLVALPSLTGLTPTCFNSCSTILISVMLRRERPTD
jgi:3-oxoacyl-ACP reductase-like protein